MLAGNAGHDLFYLEDVSGLDWIRDFELNIDYIGLADGITYDQLEITGRVNSFINYQDRELAVLLDISPQELTSDRFLKS